MFHVLQKLFSNKLDLFWVSSLFFIRHVGDNAKITLDVINNYILHLSIYIHTSAVNDEIMI